MVIHHRLGRQSKILGGFVIKKPKLHYQAVSQKISVKILGSGSKTSSSSRRRPMEVWGRNSSAQRFLRLFPIMMHF